MREAAGDFFYNSWRLVPANLVWALPAAAAALAFVVLPPLGLAISVLAVLPTAGVFRLAALIARGEPASFADALDALRDGVGGRLALGAAVVFAALVLISNFVSGLLSTSAIGWGLATLAAWGIAAGWCWLLCFWPIFLDPHRSDAGVRRAARLAALLVLAHPVRVGTLGIVLGALLAVSAVAFLSLFTVSFAYAALVACRYVLPAADRLEAVLPRGKVSRGAAEGVRAR